MKKLLILASVLMFTTSVVSFAQTDATKTTAATPTVNAGKPHCKMPPKGPDFQKRRADFENRLKLTDEQKQKAEDLHKQGFEKMKPIMEKMKEKQKEAFALKDKTDEQSVQKREELKKEIWALKRESREIQKQNMKDFEGILTKKQQKELQKIKEEGRKNFEKEFKGRPRPEFGPRPGFGPGHDEIPPQPPIEKETK